MATVIMLAAAEGCLRGLQRAGAVAIANPVIDDADLGFALRPCFKGRRWDTFVETDEYGFRVPPGAASEGRPVTVVNLGDSSTFGTGVAAASTYSVRMAFHLERARPGIFQVANLGVPGYSTRECLAQVLARRQLDRLSADVVTVYLGWNDHWLRRRGEAPSADRRFPHLRRFKAFLGEHLLAVQAIDLARARASQRWRSRGQRLANLAELDRLEAGEAARVSAFEVDRSLLNVPPEDYLENLMDLASAVRASGARLVVMVTPFGGGDLLRDFIVRHPVVDPRPFYFHDDYQDLTLEAAETACFDVVDLRADFHAGGRRLFIDPIHPSPEGHELIAERLVATIRGRL